MLRTLAEVLALRRPVLLGGPCGRALWTGRPRSGTDNMKPLEGVRILDLTRVLAGPFATMNLGDLGAEVIKVERPGAGDDTRTWGPPFVDTESIYFLSVNRNKKSIAVNMKDPKGVRIIRELAAVCDVLVENYVPGKLSKMGLGYEDIDKIAPHIIYCSITGYGQTGPMSQRAGYDAIASAISGLMHITGPEQITFPWPTLGTKKHMGEQRNTGMNKETHKRKRGRQKCAETHRKRGLQAEVTEKGEKNSTESEDEGPTC